MKINENFPQPKFQIGQEVKIKESYTMKVSEDVYVITDINISCLSVLSNTKEKDEPFTYNLMMNFFLNKPNSLHKYMQGVRESFIVAIE